MTCDLYVYVHTVGRYPVQARRNDVGVNRLEGGKFSHHTIVFHSHSHSHSLPIPIPILRFCPTEGGGRRAKAATKNFALRCLASSLVSLPRLASPCLAGLVLQVRRESGRKVGTSPADPEAKLSASNAQPPHTGTNAHAHTYCTVLYVRTNACAH